MEGYIAQLMQSSKTQTKALNPRQVFFKEFDQALRLASLGTLRANLEAHLEQLDRYGRAAGLSELELTQRKNTLNWTLAQAA